MDLSPDRDGANKTFNFILQIWRPSPTVNQSGCYSLVDDFSTTSTSIGRDLQSGRVAKATPSPQDQPQFQSGDVLRFYVESHGSGSEPRGDADNGVVLLNNSKHTSELVWFAKIASQTSQSGSCPYPVGTTGVLNSPTHAAPVISVPVMTTSCPLPSYSSLSSIISTSLPHPTRTTFTTSTRNIFTSSTRTAFTSSMITAKAPGLKSVTISSSLIFGVAVAICCMVVCISAIIIILAIIVKRHIYSKEEVDDTGMAQVYCESISIIACATGVKTSNRSCPFVVVVVVDATKIDRSRVLGVNGCASDFSHRKTLFSSLLNA